MSQHVIWILSFTFFFTCELRVWHESFSYKGVTTYFRNFLVLQESLMDCNIIFRCGNDLLIFQNLFLTKIPYLF